VSEVLGGDGGDGVSPHQRALDLAALSRVEHDLVPRLREAEAQEVATVGRVRLAELVHGGDGLPVEGLQHAPPLLKY